MSGWIKFENSTPDGLIRKTIERGQPMLSDRAFRLWFNAGCFASRALSDGLVPSSMILTLSPTANKSTVEELVTAGLLDATESGDYVVHDYLKYNPSRAEVEAMRQRSKETSEAHRLRQRRDKAGDTSRDVSPTESRSGSRDSTGDRSPSRARRPDAPHPAGGERQEAGKRGSDKPRKQSELERASDQTLLVVNTLTEQIRQRDPHAKVAPRSDLWISEARLLLERDKRPIEQVTTVLDWLPTAEFWPTVILSVPKFRAKFTELVAAMSRSDGSHQPRRPNGHDQVRERRSAALQEQRRSREAA